MFNHALAYVLSTVTAKREEKGATAVEYALVIGLVSLVLVVALVALQGPLNGLVGRIGAQIGVA